MKIPLPGRVVASVLTLLAGACGAHSALADDDPEILDKTATVVEIKIDSMGHTHHELDEWNLRKGDEFELDERPFKGELHYFDVPWNVTSPMHDPDLHVINPNKKHLSPGMGWEEFLFLFGIHDLENPDKNTKSPHALIYLPISTTVAPNDRFLLFIHHIASTDAECNAMADAFAKDFCLAMWRLEGQHKKMEERAFAAEVSREIRELFHLCACCPFPPGGSNPADRVPGLQAHVGEVNALAPGMLFDLLIKVGILLHNGVIHGTLD